MLNNIFVDKAADCSDNTAFFLWIHNLINVKFNEIIQMKISPGVLTECLLLSSTSVLVLSLWYCFSARHNLIGKYEWEDCGAIKQYSDSSLLAQRSRGIEGLMDQP